MVLEAGELQFTTCSETPSVPLMKNSRSTPLSPMVHAKSGQIESLRKREKKGDRSDWARMTP